MNNLQENNSQLSLQSSKFTNVIHTETTSKKNVASFSKIVSYSLFPTKNQAIVMDTIEGVEVRTYLKAIATKTEPTNIVAASKISQNRFCCYLNSEKIAEKLCSEGNNTIVIEGNTLTIRPYITKAKRIIFSNVHPCIPHDEIINKLKEISVTPKSNMSFIRLGLDDPGYSQIVSFRRQLFIDPEDVNKLPKDISINYDDMLHHIYVSADKITCFVCNLEGHTAKYCPSVNTSQIINTEPTRESIETIDTEVNNTLKTNTQENNSDSDMSINSDDNKVSINQPLNFNGTTLFKQPSVKNYLKKGKRLASTSSNSTEKCNLTTDNTNLDNKTNITKTIKQETKKKKLSHHKEPPTNLQKQLEFAFDQANTNESVTFVLSKQDLVNFINDSYKCKYSEVYNLSNKYVVNKEALAIMLQEIYPNITSTDIKKRITRITNCLLYQDSCSEHDTEESNNQQSPKE